jgi:hypothetical protein
MITSENIIRNVCEKYEYAEKLLLEAVDSDDEEVAYEAKFALIQLYGTGHLVMEGADTIEIPGYPNIEKLKAFVANIIEDDTDVRNMVYTLYYDFIYHNFGEMPSSVEKAMETALFAVECSEEDDCEDNGKSVAKIILFWLYYNGEYESDNTYCDVCCSSLKDRRKAAELLRYEPIMILDYNPKFGDLRDDGELDELLEEACAIYPTKDLLARNVIERCAINVNIDKIIEIVHNADKKLASFIGLDLLGEWEYFFDYEDTKYTPENIERIFIALTDKGVLPEFLLSLYQFGNAKIASSLGVYEVKLPSLQNEEKALLFSNKHGIKLLSAPVEIER